MKVEVMRNELRSQNIFSQEKIGLPQAIDVEEAVLGICMLYPDAVHDVKLKPEMFFKEAHRKIFSTILELAKSGACDIFTVSEKLRTKGELDSVGGPVELSRISSKIVTDYMLQTHVMIIKENYMRREFIRVCARITMLAYSEDLETVIETAESELLKISDFTQLKDPRPIMKCVDEYLIELEKVISKEKILSGVPSGISSLDKVTFGWQPGT